MSNLLPKLSTITPFSDEQLRLLVGLRQHYEVWMQATQALATFPYHMRWKTIGGRDYLYRDRDRSGSGTSLGPRTEDTKSIHERFRTGKAEAKERTRTSAISLDQSSRLYRALRLPSLPSSAAAILRECDRRGMLGSQLMVVGTNAVAAYALEAGGFLRDMPDETQDFDVAWMATEISMREPPIWSMLKAVDSTYTVNTERSFQARNADAYEFEVLVAPSRASAMHQRDQPRPVPLPEQEWLLLGQTVEAVVVARDGSPARLVVPDPRWFALHKLWMSEQPKRDPLKRRKDARQGAIILGAVVEAMPQFPLDAEFESHLPGELLPVYTRWREHQTWPESPVPSWRE